jgi:secondary thiamine-phosphate synthase enzyme
MEFTIRSTKREEIIDITGEVKEAVAELCEKDKKRVCNKDIGGVLVYVPHATCAIIVNENYDKAVCEDIISYLKKSVPEGVWKHDAIDNNADSHIKASLIGPGQVIPIENGKMGLGRWQGIALAEFDGPRERKIIVKIL